ncbi:conserved hypothetical protein [Ferrimonas balearica DSM 9799]|uniref:Alginate export domain-containing protein n=1 Tax=Ferrimonas balearica (strain DSM 9799 / CCM 4581 / KCTC 23876 / PAT) TaxID=550540 RepID=E1SPB6_FERBD|nr:hypothetical protein [Ferrimonas balearica]ADN75741.1 conserved hypothetical protein [Ferrimonas balearica DSM 9799]
MSGHVRFASGVPLMLALYSGAAAATIPGLAPEQPWQFGGYVKYMATATLPDQTDNGFDHLLHQRFNVEYRFSPSLRFNAGMRNRVLAGDSAELPGYGDLIGRDDGYFDLTHNWVDNKGLVATTTFDRLYLDWQSGQWQVRGGRFRINWAMATLWNPNDLFNSYSIYDFDYEERPGSDAISLTRVLGFASQADLVYNPADDSELNSAAGRYLFNHQGWDGQLVLGKAGLDNVIGAGFAGDIAGAGVRGEVSHFSPNRSEWQGQALQHATVATLESDYSFAGQRNWMVRGALLYISNPQDPGNALAFLNLPLTARTLSFTRWSGYADASFDLSPLSRITLSGTGYDDGSYFIGVNASHSLADDWQLLGVLQRFDGSDSSLFGQSPATLLFGQVRWNF